MFDTLDKNKQFIGISFDSGFLPFAIGVTEEGGEDIKGQKATHVLGCAYDTDDWYIWEAHLQYQGVRKIKLADYIKEKEANPSNIILFKEFALDIPTLNFYYDFKKFYPYDITNLFYRLLDHVPFLAGKDTKNLICSKFISMSQKGYKICYDIKLPYDQITPAHCQNYTNSLPIAFSINLKGGQNVAT